MSTTADLVAALKKELKTAQMTYADLAQPWAWPNRA
jgi:transcriptional regulator, XRE family